MFKLCERLLLGIGMPKMWEQGVFDVTSILGVGLCLMVAIIVIFWTYRNGDDEE